MAQDIILRNHKTLLVSQINQQNYFCYSNETKINGCQDIEIAQSASFKISTIHFTIEKVIFSFKMTRLNFL